MRMFGSDRIARIMDRLGLEEGEVIQHSMISRSIERAQKKVEENNYGIRKRLLEYDDVMNSQREVIYTKRRHALFGERIGVDFANMVYDVAEALASEYAANSDYETLSLEIMRNMSIQNPIGEKEILKMNSEEIADQIYGTAINLYKRRAESISEKSYPAIKQVIENQGDRYKNIVIPVSDGIRIFQVVIDLQKGLESKGKEVVKSFMKTLMLISIDEAWKEHLRELDDLKQSVQNASYEQKDPLLIYKFESFELFSQMLQKINKEIVAAILRAHIPVQAEPVQQREPARVAPEPKYTTNKQEAPQMGKKPEAEQREEPKHQPIRVDKKVGRNDACPCGSGKKYKNCHGE